MKINILLCDTFDGLLPPSIPSYLSMFTDLFDEAAGADDRPEYHVFETMKGELPPPDAPGLHVISGCNLSAYDDVPWVKSLLQWIVAANRARTKVCGICFGHQCVAQALGGKVEKAAAGWGIGIRESSLVDPWTESLWRGSTTRLLYNHHDQVTALPQGATLVATSRFCPIESYRIGGHILCFQGHPEYKPEYDRHLIRNFAPDEPRPVKSAALHTLDTMQHQGLQVARMLLEWAKVE